uniref:Chlorophyll a-b binding protein, chloroplastic n=1 Tax=Mesostigma viride TaxID=41882 RepID=A2SY16_MESVI|nr:light-harvesting chlorophyll-a/b binding protein Lhca4.2 [Mesostigma viride]DAA05926.1 TPA_inf: chloroplast light-harvesting complex I protein precursor Lhca5 [Mesostigma viride]
MAASVSQMIQASTFLGSKVAPVARATAAKPQAKFAVFAAKADRPLWCPGIPAPSYLDGSLPGDFGYDPLSLSNSPDKLKWMVQAELQNARWAMLGVAGMLSVDLLQGILPDNVPQWYDAPLLADVYPAEWKSLFIIQMILMGFVEARRWADINTPGSANVDPVFNNNKLPDSGTPGYPGGMFDPLGFSKGNLEESKWKELRNGRLAMVASLGMFIQYDATGKSPLTNLADHLADPWHNNVCALLPF